MTALAGILAMDHRPVEDLCARMLDAQSIYGRQPALWADQGLAMGRRLFPTVPEDGFDSGPQVGASGRVLVADVRLDNRAELLAELGLDGRGRSEAAIVLAALETWGDEGVGRLVGDFALASWEPSRRRLLLARDYAGHRPLHYHAADGFFAFASMPKGLHALADVPRAPDVEAVSAWLAGLSAEPSSTFFLGLRKVEPGHTVAVSPAGLQTSRFWRPDLTPLRLPALEDYSEALIEKLDAAVVARLRGAGREVGAQLSGGLDSGAVAATAARLLAPSGGKVVAFTAVPRRGYHGPVPRGRLADEGSLAAATARLYPNIEHVLVHGGGDGLLGRADRAFFLNDGFAGSPFNAGWLDAIKEAAGRRRLSVLFSGQFGNVGMSYSGDGYLAELLARGRILRLAGEAIRLRRSGDRLRAIANACLSPFLPEKAWRWIARLRGATVDLADHSLVRPEVLTQLRSRGLRPRALGRPARDSLRVRLDAIQRFDPGASNKGALAGWGVDYRDPTADRRLMEFCLRVPLDVYFTADGGRGLARRALAGRLPDEVLGAQVRGLQAADWHEALCDSREALLGDVERMARVPEVAAAIDVERMRRMLQDLPARGWEEPAVLRDYRAVVTRTLAAAGFIIRATGRND